jgi:hypothetical protein
MAHRHIKRRRQRATKAEGEERREALLAIIDDGKPMTVRQVFYQATVRGLVEEAESGYAKVQVDLTKMRRDGSLPYDWLADNTRWQPKPRTFNGVEEALRATAAFYRKDLWADADCYVEIWLEKDALAGVIYPITSMFDVPLMVARGYASLSFLYSAAEYINDLTVPTYIYHLGDFDPSGVNAGEKIEETLREMAPDADISFERIAVTPEQIAEWNLPTRPTKASDSRAKNFREISVELDAIDPNALRALVQKTIEQPPSGSIRGAESGRAIRTRNHRPPSREGHVVIRARRLDHLNMKVEGVIAAMRDGAVLYRLHQPNSTWWMLSTGRRVNAEVTRLVTERGEIVGVGDCLFGPELSQTWRFIGRWT